jgi:hypothetical protein
MTLNRFTGRSDAWLLEMYKKQVDWYVNLDPDEELGGGSPLESYFDGLDDLELEIIERGLSTKAALDKNWKERNDPKR